MNDVTLIGRLVQDPDVKETTNGKAVLRFKMAVDRKFKQDGQPDADFPSCITFGKNAVNMGKYLKKGSMLAVKGRLQTGSYTNKDGATIYTTDVMVEEVKFLSFPKAVTDSNQESTDTNEAFSGFNAIDENVPF